MRNAAIALVLVGLAGCTTLGQIPTSKVATAQMHLANGTPAGTAVITAAGDKLTLSVAAIGLPRGLHGMHLHAIGRCDGPAFTTAGGHLNPAAHQHGSLNPAGKHLGDLPNLDAGMAGSAVLNAELDGTRAEIEAALFDSDGTALVIHADPDDYKTDPSGNSGTRIACGVLKRG